MLRHAPVTSLASLSHRRRRHSGGARCGLGGLCARGRERRCSICAAMRSAAACRTSRRPTSPGYLVSGEAQTVPAPSPYQLALRRAGAALGRRCRRRLCGRRGARRRWRQVRRRRPGNMCRRPRRTGSTSSPPPMRARRSRSATATRRAISSRPASSWRCCASTSARGSARRRKTLAGEVVSFVQKDMTASVATALQPYRRVVPIP